MLKISEAAVLAIHTAALLGASEGEVLTTREIAEFLGASEAHLSKVLQRLGRRGIVRSVRGPHGGFALARAGEDITLLEVFEAIDGPLQECACLLDAPVCRGRCIMGDVITDVGAIVKKHLTGTRLSEVRTSMERNRRDAEKDNQDRS